MRIVCRVNGISRFSVYKGNVLESNGSTIVNATATATKTVNNNFCINGVVGTCILLPVDGEFEVSLFRNSDGLATDVVDDGDGLCTTHLFGSVHGRLQRAVFCFADFGDSNHFTYSPSAIAIVMGHIPYINHVIGFSIESDIGWVKHPCACLDFQGVCARVIVDASESKKEE